MTFQRHPANPVFPNVPGTWREDQTANPDLLRIGDVYHMYFRGQQGGHDRIGLATIPVDRFDGVTWDIREEVVVDVGGPGAPDECHALDPATVLVDGTVYLYYSAVSTTCPRSICLATSIDGIHFTKHAANPVVIGGGPEIVVKDGVFHLFSWSDRPGGGFQLHLATSRDGADFTPHPANPVLPAGPPGAWDSHTVETPRIFEEHGVYHMLYCGSDRHDDYPFHAGLATSRDLVHWEKSAANPVFERGAEGEWDEGAIWFTTVEKIDGRYWMWYEGYGGGTARHEPYGTYLTQGRSQVGLATMDGDRFLPAGTTAT